jgi:hypothetical protein
MSEVNKIIDLAEATFHTPNYEGPYCATDDPRSWSKDILKEQPDLVLERLKTYNYKFNNQGFRCDEFTTTSELPILFLGCSHTMGVSLELQDVWSKILLEKIKDHTGKKIPFWNLAIPGSSIDRQGIVLEKFIHKLNPKLIFFLIPNMFRRHIILNDKVIDYKPSHMSSSSKEYGHAIIRNLSRSESMLLNENYAAYESYKNLRLIDTLAELKKSKIYYHIGVENQGINRADSQPDVNHPDGNLIKSMCNRLSSFNNLNLPFERHDLARDGSHLGKISHRKFAESVFEKIKDRL